MILNYPISNTKFFIDFIREISVLCFNHQDGGSLTCLSFGSGFSANEFTKESKALGIELELLRNIELNFDSYTKDSLFSILADKKDSVQLRNRKNFDCRLSYLNRSNFVIFGC